MTLPVVLGWREWVDLPGLGLDGIRAKVDSGARTSALHVDAQWRFFEAGQPWVGFRVTPGANGTGAVEGAAVLADERDVTDSGGHRTRRAFIRTSLRLGGIEREIDINLTDRRRMLFPMLLGRTAMARAFTVDPARSFLHGRRILVAADAPSTSPPAHHP